MNLQNWLDHSVCSPLLKNDPFSLESNCLYSAHIECKLDNSSFLKSKKLLVELELDFSTLESFENIKIKLFHPRRCARCGAYDGSFVLSADSSSYQEIQKFLHNQSIRIFWSIENLDSYFDCITIPIQIYFDDQNEWDEKYKACLNNVQVQTRFIGKRTIQ